MVGVNLVVVGRVGDNVAGAKSYDETEGTPDRFQEAGQPCYDGRPHGRRSHGTCGAWTFESSG